MAKTTLPAKVEEYTALQAQSSFTKAETTAFKELDSYIKKYVKENILWYWELGQRVAKIYKAAKKNKDVYGTRLLLRLAKGLGYKTDRQLHNAMDVVDRFGTKAAFTKYLKMRGEAGNMLQWSHLVYLANVGDLDIRMQLAASSLEQCWTAEELWSKVKELCAREPRGSGRPPSIKIPGTARACLTHVQSQAAKFVSNCDHAWTGDAFDLIATVKDIPADKLNDTLLSAVLETRERIVELRARADQMDRVLSDTRVSIEARMAKQAALADAAAAADEDAEPSDPEVQDDDDPDAINMAKLKSQQAREARAVKRQKAKKRKGRVGVSK